jgi:uncharacterized radical SAM superfamily Fe-S cluster-containing enzyme
MRAHLAPPLHYRQINARFDTLANLCLSEAYKRNLAAYGIYYDGANGYKCAFCSFYLKRLDAHDLKYHTYSLCPMATQRLVGNITLRKQSFLKFKTSRLHYKNNYEELAQNGFYYFGKKFEIRCSSCLLIINKLTKNDCVSLIHRAHSPDCSFNASPAPVPPPKITYVSNIYPQLPKFNLHDDYFDNDDDDAAAEQCDEDKQTSSPTQSVNGDDLMCKICFEKARDTCFMPCRHMSTCSECASRCKICCICRIKVQDRIKIFLQ